MYDEGGGGGGGGTGGGGSPDAGTQLGQALINALVIVCVVAGATFVLVGCYYFRCFKAMMVYLV